ncbi:MAG: putative response regulator receiver domain protein [Dactylosporangium sp.]|jgi:CheY-like chemotaxis protein|nr:putative response regulator receiver domain protein [Dactylosporangium sp.]
MWSFHYSRQRFEDDADLLAAFTRVLTRAGHSVIACCDGDSALTQVRTQRPDLVLTDVDMPPGMSGLDMAATIRANPLATGSPVIVATGGRIRAEVAAAFGVTLLLRKPIPPSALVAHVEAVLASSQDTPSAASAGA